MDTNHKYQPIFQQRTTTTPNSRVFYWIRHHWIVVFALVLGLYVGLPFLAPVLMQLGWTGAGKVIYTLYATQCHQLPQRSYFLFGPQPMYSLGEVQSMWDNTQNPLILRQFIGNPQVGWKVAWSDRMVSMYTSLLIFGALWWFVRGRVKALPWWGFILLLLPLFIDGFTHLISDFAGIGQGFRDSNTWLVAITGNTFSPSFYTGDALGSFNSWMRLVTGVLFGLAIVWVSFPFLDIWFQDLAKRPDSGDLYRD